jgi:hypothetical protein
MTLVSFMGRLAKIDYQIVEMRMHSYEYESLSTVLLKKLGWKDSNLRSFG